MKKTILITGGTGMIGTALAERLIKQGHSVKFLSRKEDLNAAIPTYKWRVSYNHIDPQALENTDVIIHLAGANVGEGEWTEKRKSEIIESRISPTKLLHAHLKENPHAVKQIICVSAIGFYGNRGDEKLTVDSKQGHGFLAEVCILWEQELNKFKELNITTSINRLGVVLSKNEGALVPIFKSVQLGVGVVLGSGKQHFSWVSLDDVCNWFAYQIEHPQNGVYNVVQSTLTYSELITKIMQFKFPFSLFKIRIPNFIMKKIMGEQSTMVTYSQNCVPNFPSDFKIEFPTIESVLKH